MNNKTTFLFSTGQEVCHGTKYKGCFTEANIATPTAANQQCAGMVVAAAHYIITLNWTLFCT